MVENPFETPQAQAGVDPRAASGKFDIGQCLSDAWRITIENIGLWLGVMLVGGMLMMLSYVTIVGIFFLVPIFAWGMLKFMLNLYDGKAEFGDMFAGFKCYWQALGSVLLLGLVFLALAIPGQALSIAGAAAESTALSLLGSLVSLVITFGVTLRLYFAFFFMVDQDMPAFDAVKASWNATSDQKLMTFVLALLSGLVAMSGIIAFIIGVIFTGMMSYVMWVSAYRQMVGESPSSEVMDARV